MKAWVFFGLALAVSNLQAASIQKDTRAVPADPNDKNPMDIVVSATLNSDLSSEYFGYFDFTLENKSDKWLTVSRIKISFPDSFQNYNIRFVTGKEFLLWQSAMKKIIAINQQNKETALATIAALGYGLAAFSGNRTLSTIGGAAALGAAGTYGASQYNQRIDSLENAKMFPENHLLGDSLVIPPGLFVDRWLLVNSQNHDQMEYVTSMKIELESTDGRVRNLLMKFRPTRSSSTPKWQRTIFERKGYVCTTSTNYSDNYPSAYSTNKCD